MNKILILSSIILLIVLLVLPVVGCQQQATPAPTPKPTPVPAPAPAPEPKAEPKPTPSPEPKVVELKYDDGSAEDMLSVGGGCIVDFTPPDTPFVINKVQILGGLYGSGWEDKIYSIAIWDKDYKLIHLEERPVTDFEVKKHTKVDVEIPDVEVDGQFYIHVWTGTGRMEGIHIGADDSASNEHSSLTVRQGDKYRISSDWPYPSSKWFGDKSKVNWMIRVVGTIMVEE